MPQQPANSPAPRVNLRMIAARAGVSLTAVSFALRNNPRIPLPTRQRVQRAAEELGYRPDPEIAKLMHHLRARRPPGFQSTICALTTIPEAEELPYLRDIGCSARGRAEALGYNLMSLRIEDTTEPRRDLQRMLLSRGVEGILLLPMRRAQSFERLFDWSKFAVVAATNGVLAPEFHRVVPHQFSNMSTVCHEVAKQGYRRIGLVQPAQHAITVGQAFSAAVLWKSFLGGAEPVMPLIYEGPRPEKLGAWFERERPDVIVATGEADARAYAHDLGLKVPGRVGFAVGNRTPNTIFAGIEERPAEIGGAAIRLLASLVQHGEKGVPAVPTVTMVKGEWVSGASLPMQRASWSRPRSATARR
jgi:DNA-binding LacI/PurR family transcriptional regulator